MCGADDCKRCRPREDHDASYADRLRTARTAREVEERLEEQRRENERALLRSTKL
jgi:hypothetical protein